MDRKVLVIRSHYLPSSDAPLVLALFLVARSTPKENAGVDIQHVAHVLGARHANVDLSAEIRVAVADCRSLP